MRVTADSMRVVNGLGPQGATCGACMSCVLRPTPSLPNRHVCMKAPTRTTSHGEERRPMWTKSWIACALFRERVV